MADHWSLLEGKPLDRGLLPMLDRLIVTARAKSRSEILTELETIRTYCTGVPVP